MYIKPFSSKRIKAQIQEISIKDILKMCEVPEILPEQANEYFLQGIIQETNLPLSQWTIQERYGLIGHYLMAKNEGDFAVSSSSTYTDYVIGDDYPDEAFSFTTESGKTFTIYPLTSEYLLAIESIVAGEMLSETKDNKKLSYLIASMAAQIREKEHEEGDVESHIIERANEILSAPESEFLFLTDQFQQGLEQIMHFFNYWVSDSGFVFLPGTIGEQKNREAGTDIIPPARFPVHERIQSRTYQLTKKPC